MKTNTDMWNTHDLLLFNEIHLSQKTSSLTVTSLEMKNKIP